MTVEKVPSELRRAALVKAARTAVRLKHSLAADAELNAVLPKLEQAFDAAVARGTLPEDVDLTELTRKALSDG